MSSVYKLEPRKKQVWSSKSTQSTQSFHPSIPYLPQLSETFMLSLDYDN